MKLAPKPVVLLLAAAMLPLQGGCAGGIFGTLGPDYVPPQSAAAPAWQAPQAAEVAHEGSTARLADWWAQFNDRALQTLIADAQRHSSSLAQAAAAIERARADAIAAGVADAPGVSAVANSTRSAFTLGGPATLRTQSQLGVQASWEIDLFGGLARQRESREANLAASISSWHDARVALAAEVANAYVNYRHCEIQLAQSADESRSRAETARITAAAARAGLQSASTAQLTQAAAADVAGALEQRRTQCDIAVKGLVSLTAMPEPALRRLLAETRPAAARLPEPARFRIDALPARVIAQRPDIATAERQLAAASADIGSAEADRYPRLTLSGNILPTRIAVGNSPALSLTTWSIGPSLELPLIDGGRRQANVEAARAQYASAESVYRARVRNAVREVEEALVRLASAASRENEVQTAARAYRANLDAAIAMQRTGLGNALEVEDARRLSLAAEGNLAALMQERVAAWIALYRAAGGGWESATVDSPSIHHPDTKTP